MRNYKWERRNFKLLTPNSSLINQIPSNAAKDKKDDRVGFEVCGKGDYSEDNNADVVGEVVLVDKWNTCS